MTELVDLFPSICELAGVDVPDYLQGDSFVPLLDNPELPWKRVAFSQFHRRPKVALDGGRYMGYSMNTEAHHYTEWYTWDHNTGTRGEYVSAELYDRLGNPHEKINVAEMKENSTIVEKLSDQLADGWRKARPD